jgi:hypothetical protein
MPRTSGGHAQRFCCSPCRRAYDAAGRRFVAEAIACGLLSLDQIRKGAAARRALGREADSPALTHPADEAKELLDDFLSALLKWPDEEWFALMERLPYELVERICNRLVALLS